MAVMALVYLVLIYKFRCIFVMCMRVFVYPECLRCAACSPSLSPLVLHGSRRELWATVVPFCSVGLFLFVVPLTSVILLDAFRILVGKLGFLIRYIFEGFSQCRVVMGYALQVSPAVTRLTVYRRLQVFMANGSFRRQLLRICTSDLDALLKRHSLGT